MDGVPRAKIDASQGANLATQAPVVFIVDDDPAIRESVEGLIRSFGWRPHVFASAEAFLAQPPPECPSCLVLDVSLPDLTGLELQERIARDRLAMPIIFITGHPDVPMTVQAMKAGAVEFLTKPFSRGDLLSAIEHAIGLSRTELRRESRIAQLRGHYATLSRREMEVMDLVVRGRLNKQVGGELGISEITVKAHRGKVMRKMRARTFAELVRNADLLDVDREPSSDPQ